MKIEAFATLAAVLRNGSFAAAAVECNVTPSAVSMQMKQLELYLGQPLFDRSGLQVRPTALARELGALMHGPLQGLEALRKRSGVAVEGAVRLGVIESMQPVVLPHTMRLLRERHPLLELRPVRGRSSGLTAQVKSGELDAALVAEPGKGGSARLHWAPMFRRELLLVAPASAREASAAALFRKYDWIRYDRATITGALAAQYVHAQIHETRGSLEFDSAAAIVAMVSAGLGISVLQISDPGLLKSYPVRTLRLGRGAPVVQFSLVMRKTDAGSRALEAVVDAMRTALLDGGDTARPGHRAAGD
ncbi:LysR family transcriptional regulator [Xylophilus sp. GOD-11R]|uniref:LysR family transcriptional regulator n=1 Tax=Xylophilus sp. GOD-11R TaxID=3089814 RepID=UPI00298D1D67|nr:LysR family transcriptional regulator [Xylophilus sp. GOD-11R]WPB55816.1 LysR family transcriptional regulator [Xylophilus sp. GOD-11R]